jgi:glycosyltransferase involved in cell wall biosynthesis
MTKIVHLTSVHDAFDVRIFHKECRALAEAGYNVTIIAPHPADEWRDGVQVRAVPVPSSRRERLTKTVVNVFRQAVREKADIYHFHDPELMTVALGLKLLGKTVIYDVHENYRATFLSKAWLPPYLRKFASALVGMLEALVGHCCDAVVAANSGIVQRFPTRKAHLVRNFPEVELFKKYAAKSGDGTEKRNDIAYIGVMARVRGAAEMVDAVGRLPEQLGARVLIAGRVPQDLQQELQKDSGWSRTRLLGTIPHEDVIKLLNECRIGLCALYPTPNHMETLPIKLFEYMAAGIPAIVSDFPNWREFVAPSNCGILLDPKSIPAIVEAMTFLLQNPDEAERMGKSGQRAVFERFNWEAEASVLLNLYKRLDQNRDALTKTDEEAVAR